MKKTSASKPKNIMIELNKQSAIQTGHAMEKKYNVLEKFLNRWRASEEDIKEL